MSERVSEIKSSIEKIVSVFEEEILRLQEETDALKRELQGVKSELNEIKKGIGNNEDLFAAPQTESRKEPEDKKPVTAEFGAISDVLFEVVEDEGDDERPSLLGELFSAPDSIAKKAQEKGLLWMTDIPGEKVDDITDAISLNDKLFFIRELFGGDDEQFSLTIDRLNEAKSFNQALSECRSAFTEWDETSDAVYRFYMAVRRKFA